MLFMEIVHKKWTSCSVMLLYYGICVREKYDEKNILVYHELLNPEYNLICE